VNKKLKCMVAAVFVVVCGASHAGMFSHHLSDKDAAGIHHIAVVSLVGDKLHIDKIGLTVFNNAAQEVPVPQWTMDSLITLNAVKEIQAGGRFAADRLHLEAGEVSVAEDGTMSKADRRFLIERARAQGADTLLMVAATQNPNDRSLSPGYGLYDRRLFGHDGVFLLASVRLAVIRVDDDSVLAQSFPDPLVLTSHPWPKPSTWQEMSADQQADLEKTIKEHVIGQMSKAIVALRLSQ
jgi:hypothetical protein